MAGDRNENEHPAKHHPVDLDLQPIFNIASICHQHGLDKAILSPGSRNAPLTLAFTRHPDIDCRTVSDERSAAFIGLGIARQLDRPTILCCTSGSAAYNYAPAVAEAFFQQIPLLIFTADRPPEWIDQLDGQTIRQVNIYGDHVKKSFQLPVDLDNPEAKTHTYRIINEAINHTQEFPKGPVHINVPFREPFYPGSGEKLHYKEPVKVFTTNQPQPGPVDWEALQQEWNQYQRKLIVAGQYRKSTELNADLTGIFKDQKIPVAGDILSNLHAIDEVIAHADVFIGNGRKGLNESLQPDLLITYGLSTISKNLKLLLRKYPPRAHWHIQPAGEVADTYNALTKIIRTSPEKFFRQLSAGKTDDSFESQKQENYCNIWLIEERKVRRHIPSFFSTDHWGEFELVYHALKAAPSGINLHLANSMAVRYANFIGIETQHEETEVLSNRGTSGIDGSNSTAVGASLESDRLNLLITGDMAFFYDRNAFWHNYDIKNLRILLLNNHGGGIFRMIPGPGSLPELEDFFETRQPLSAGLLAKEMGFEYLNCDKKSKLNNYLKQFFKEDGQPRILELESDSAVNKQILEEFRSSFNKTK